MISMFIDPLNKRILLNYLIDSENSNILLILLQSIFAILGRIAFPIFLFLIVVKEYFLVLGFILLNLYNNERGNINNWIGYVFYLFHRYALQKARLKRKI